MYNCFPSIYLTRTAVLDVEGKNQHTFLRKKGGKLHYQLKLLSRQRKYQTFNISSLKLIHNTYCSLCVRK